MPEITELLQDAAPSARPFDEAALRRRVGARRRRRYGVAMAALVVVAGMGVAAAVVASDPPSESVVAEEPLAGAEVTALALVHDEVWTAGERWAANEDGSIRIELPGAVRMLVAGDVLWAAGDAWVTAIDPSTGEQLGSWGGDGIDDLQPLTDRRVAVSQPAASRVVVLGLEGAGLSVVQSIDVPGNPTNLVLTDGNELWVNDGEVICRIDVDAGVAVDERPWTGTLLAASRSGGIWSTDGSRVVDLHPDDLDVGASVAQGQRYEATATMAVETASGLYVGGPDGVTRHDPGGGELLDPAEPDDLAGTDSIVVYLVDGEVRRVHADPPVAVEGDAGFCAVLTELDVVQPESYVGSAAHVEHLQRLQAVTPPDVRPAVDTVLAYVESGAIDAANDPDSTDRSTWPADVQAAASTVANAEAARCG